MRPRRGAAEPPGRGVNSDPLTLIHTSNCSNPHGCSLSGPLVVRYGLEWGVSEAVVQTAFALAVQLVESDAPGRLSHAALRRAVSTGGRDAKSTP
jgi:hypothetical protein